MIQQTALYHNLAHELCTNYSSVMENLGSHLNIRRGHVTHHSVFTLSEQREGTDMQTCHKVSSAPLPQLKENKITPYVKKWCYISYKRI